MKFYFKLGSSCAETIDMMQKAFVDVCMGITQTEEWYKKFKKGRTSVDSDSCSWRSSTTTRPDNIDFQLKKIVE